MKLIKRFLKYVYQMMFSATSKPNPAKLDSSIMFMLEELGFDSQVEVKKEEDNAGSKSSVEDTL